MHFSKSFIGQHACEILTCPLFNSLISVFLSLINNQSRSHFLSFLAEVYYKFSYEVYALHPTISVNNNNDSSNIVFVFMYTLGLRYNIFNLFNQF